MSPTPPQPGKPATEPHKSWKKINEERKQLKKQRKQERVLKQLEQEEAALKPLSTAEQEQQKQSTKKRSPSTISIAVPGSILENAQSAELRSYVAGQIARAACIFRVQEIIVFDDVGIATARETKRDYAADEAEGAEDGQQHTVRSSSLQLARILQFLECPQYLRKFFFPLHKDLKYSGLLNPLDAPHHLRQQNVFRYREGVICEKKAKEGHAYANVGLLNDVLVDKAIAAGVRVTVKLENLQDPSKKLRGSVVSPDEPRRDTGIYWGYTVRIAHSLAEIFTKSPYEGGYDLTVGTSDRGKSVHEVPGKTINYKHLLLVFGGLKGLEEALSNDDKLNVDDPALLFDYYVNVLPRQGSRTIRTEEAVLIAMAALQEKFNAEVPEPEEKLEEFMLPRSEDTGMHLPMRKKQNKRPQESIVQNDVPIIEKKRKNMKQIEQRESRDVKNPFKPNGSDEGAEMKVAAVKGKVKKLKVPEEEADDLEIVPVMRDNMNSATVADAKLGDLSRFD